MASIETIQKAVTTAGRGFRDGVAAGNTVVNATRRVDSAMTGAPTGIPRMDRAMQGYAGGQRADRMRQQFARTNPRSTGGPRTAAFYAYRYNRPNAVSRGDPSAGTPHQHEMLERLRRQHEQIRQAAEQPRTGAYRDNTPPTRDDHIRNFASSPADAQRAMTTETADDHIRNFASTPALAERAMRRRRY